MCGERYIDTAIRFAYIVKENNDGIFPVDLSSLSDDVVENIIFSIILQQHNFDLLVFAFLKFSCFNCLNMYKGAISHIFELENPEDNCFFLYCLLRHMNSVLYGFADIKTLCSFCGEDVILERMPSKNKRSLLYILRHNFNYIFESS